MGQTRSAERRVGAETCVSIGEMLNMKREDVRERLIHSPIDPADHGAIPIPPSVVYHLLLNYSIYASLCQARVV